MSPQSRPIFLERHGYRQRRLIDAARLLPVLGVILLAVPLLWPQPDAGAAVLGEGGAGGGLPTSRAIIYIFATWAGLALVSALLVRALPAEAVDRLDSGAPPPMSGGGGGDPGRTTTGGGVAETAQAEAGRTEAGGTMGRVPASVATGGPLSLPGVTEAAAGSVVSTPEDGMGTGAGAETRPGSVGAG